MATKSLVEKAKEAQTAEAVKSAAQEEEHREVVANVPTFDKLAEAVKEAKYKQSETLNELTTTRTWHLSEVEKIDVLLADLGFPIDKNDEEPSKAPAAPAAHVGNGKATVPPPAKVTTIMGGVEALLLKYKDGLGRGDICGKMVSEMGFKPKSDSKEDNNNFANNIYTGGINKGVQEERFFAVGKRPNTLYKHAQNMSKKEIEDAKAAKEPAVQPPATA